VNLTTNFSSPTLISCFYFPPKSQYSPSIYTPYQKSTIYTLLFLFSSSHSVSQIHFDPISPYLSNHNITTILHSYSSVHFQAPPIRNSHYFFHFTISLLFP